MEVINRPKHYDHPSGYQCVDVCGDLPGFLFNALKYLWRDGKKAGHDALEDAKKSLWYFEAELNRVAVLGLKRPEATQRSLVRIGIVIAAAPDTTLGRCLTAIYNTGVDREYQSALHICVSITKTRVEELEAA